jgi:hypothetical protein
MPGRKGISQNRSEQLQDQEITHKSKNNRWPPANESLTKAELVLLRSYLLFHLIYNLGSLVVTQLHDLGSKASLW